MTDVTINSEPTAGDSATSSCCGSCGTGAAAAPRARPPTAPSSR